MPADIRRSRYLGYNANGITKLYLFPQIGLIFGLIIIPTLMSIVWSFSKSDLFGIISWIGWSNYKQLLSDSIFQRVILNTILFVVMTTPAICGIALFIAFLLNRPSRSAMILRAIFISPMALSVSTVALIWRMIYLVDGGPVSATLNYLGLKPIALLNDENFALAAVAIATIWWCLGFPIMLFIAALQRIPTDIYEAALLDSATPYRMKTKIQIPSVWKTIGLVLATELALQSQVFGQVQLMTLGGPSNSTQSVVLFAYNAAYLNWELGYAAATAQILTLLILIFSGIYMVAIRER